LSPARVRLSCLARGGRSAADKAAIEQAERVEQVTLEVSMSEPIAAPKKKARAGAQQLPVMA